MPQTRWPTIGFQSWACYKARHLTVSQSCDVVDNHDAGKHMIATDTRFRRLPVALAPAMLLVVFISVLSCTLARPATVVWWGVHQGNTQYLELEISETAEPPRWVRVRSLDEGTVGVSTQPVRLVPEDGAVGLCNSRTPRGRYWAIVNLPSSALAAFTRGNSAAFRFEVFAAGLWQPARAQDSGCRSYGRG